MGSRNYRDLIAWQKAMDLTEAVYSVTSRFPAEEKFSLTSQLRRCAISVPSNIAEGQGRFSQADFKRFLSIAHGSLREAETQILLAARLNYVTTEIRDALIEQTSEVGRLIQGLARSLQAD